MNSLGYEIQETVVNGTVKQWIHQNPHRFGSTVDMGSSLENSSP